MIAAQGPPVVRQATVLDDADVDRLRAARRPGNGRGPRESPQVGGAGKAVLVVADFGQHTAPRTVPKPGAALITLDISWPSNAVVRARLQPLDARSHAPDNVH